MLHSCNRFVHREAIKLVRPLILRLHAMIVPVRHADQDPHLNFVHLPIPQLRHTCRFQTSMAAVLIIFHPHQIFQFVTVIVIVVIITGQCEEVIAVVVFESVGAEVEVGVVVLFFGVRKSLLETLLGISKNMTWITPLAILAL